MISTDPNNIQRHQSLPVFHLPLGKKKNKKHNITMRTQLIQFSEPTILSTLYFTGTPLFYNPQSYTTNNS